MKLSRDWPPIERLPEAPGVVLRPDIVAMLLDYDPETGVLTWKERPRTRFSSDHRWRHFNSRSAGKTALDYRGSGYCVGAIFGKSYKAHRVAWACHYGEWPQGIIDHINGDGTDNRICNLRVVTDQENAMNKRLNKRNKIGAHDVHYAPHIRKWIARISFKGERKHLGVFKTLEEAKAARSQAERDYGYHTNHGRVA